MAQATTTKVCMLMFLLLRYCSFIYSTTSMVFSSTPEAAEVSVAPPSAAAFPAASEANTSSFGTMACLKAVSAHSQPISSSSGFSLLVSLIRCKL